MCEVSNSTSNSDRTSSTSDRVPRNRTASATPRLRASDSNFGRSGPSPTTRNRAAGSFSTDRRRNLKEHLVVLLRPQRRHDAGHGRRRVQTQFLLQSLARRARMKPLGVNAVGNHDDLAGGAAFVFGQVAAVRFGHRDESVGQRRQQAVGKLDVVGQTGRVQRRADHRHARKPTGQPPPEHLVAAGADGHYGVDPPASHQPRQPPEDREVVFLRKQAGEGRHFSRQFFAQPVKMFQATEFRREPLAVHAADELRQQRLRPAHRHTRDDEHHPQRAAIGNRRQFSAARKHGR